jgi:hypothetical protein
MEDLSQWESKKYLVEVSGVTERQITRWHFEGLIPKPKQRRLGRGRGTETVYPIGTAKQLLALVSIRSKNRRLANIAWGLWWQGYAVEMILIRDFLVSSVSNWGKWISEVFDARTGELKPKTRKSIKTGLQSHHKAGFLRRIKNAVGEERVSEMIHLLLQIITGRYGSNSDRAETDNFDVGKLIGLQPDEIDQFGIKPRMEKNSLAEISQLFGKTSWSSVIQKSSDDELMQARNEFLQVLTTLDSLSLVAEKLWGKKTLWLVLPGKWLRDMEPQHQALFIIFWRILGKTQLRVKIEQILNLCKLWIGIAFPHYQALEQLKMEIPSLSEDVTKIMKAVLRKEGSDDYLKGRLQNLRKKHEKELDAFWERHPEYTALATEI